LKQLHQAQFAGDQVDGAAAKNVDVTNDLREDWEVKELSVC
jgi:hypothetical protein